ncbi:MAG: 2-hydroxyacyl-CoA dehydratase [Clostridia bacterium]|nr:2-hydroxyacyl-CoA dehydratase [Clostridia bacterium]
MVDFTKQMKREYTILCPDIFPMHMGLFEKIFRNNGYKLEVVRDEGKEVIDAGLKYIHNDMCYPAICSCGQLIYALESGRYDVHKTALIFFQTGGGCRASNYIFLLRKALEEMGLSFVPVISVSFAGLEKYSGFKLTVPMLLSGFASVVYGDMLMLLKNQVEPYEKNKGDTEKVTQKWLADLSEGFKRKTGFSKKKILRNLSAIAKDFHEIPKTPKPLVKVGIVGEIYVKYSPFANRGLEKFLLGEGCEIMVPGVMGFLQYCAANVEVDHRYYGGSFIKYFIGQKAEKILAGYDGLIEKALEDYPEFVTPASFEKIKLMADKVIDRGVKMGEGWLLPGEVAELIEKGYNNVVCAQPFGCLPNHIVGKGTIRKLRELYPDANIFPVDYDAGASKVNQENRIKLMLSIAREEKAV